MLHLSAALAAAAQADHDTTATHLDGATALAARMDIEVGTWADWRFGSTKVGIRKTSIALELREPGQAIHAAKTVHRSCYPNPARPRATPAVANSANWPGAWESPHRVNTATVHRKHTKPPSRIA